LTMPIIRGRDRSMTRPATDHVADSSTGADDRLLIWEL
jgi:hypothetical protein